MPTIAQKIISYLEENDALTAVKVFKEQTAADCMRSSEDLLAVNHAVYKYICDRQSKPHNTPGLDDYLLSMIRATGAAIDLNKASAVIRDKYMLAITTKNKQLFDSINNKETLAKLLPLDLEKCLDFVLKARAEGRIDMTWQ